MTICQIAACCVAGALLAGGTRVLGQSGDAHPPGEFGEVYGLVRSNLTMISGNALERAALKGLLEELQPFVSLVTNRPPETAAAGERLVSRTNVFDGVCGYIRVGEVEAGLAKRVLAAVEDLSKGKKLSGLVLDLRFANGYDYTAAAETADLFLSTDQLLLKLGDTSLRSTAQPSDVEMPVVILMNRETRGAAEALAAVLRQENRALTIGARSAGKANVFKEFALQSGRKLRVATGAVQLGNGQELSREGVTPDIRIEIAKEEEEAYFADPYREVPRPLARSARGGTNALSRLFDLGGPQRRRTNELELERLRREGLDLHPEPEVAEEPRQPLPPVVTDPALARGIDFIKGLALVKARR